MTDLTWVDVGEAMLTGGRELPEAKGRWWEDAAGEATNVRVKVVAACAEGCVTWALDAETKFPSALESGRAAWRELESRYAARFGVPRMFMHNDLYGRDHVLANVKELLNEASP